GIVQSIIETRDRARSVTKGRMRRDVLDALAVDIDLAAVAQAFQIFRAGEGPAGGRDGVLAFGPVHRGSPCCSLSLFAALASRGTIPRAGGAHHPLANEDWFG